MSTGHRVPREGVAARLIGARNAASALKASSTIRVSLCVRFSQLGLGKFSHGQFWCLTMRLSDTRWRCRQSKLLNPHPQPPWIFTEAVPRDRSSRLLDVSQPVEFELLIEVIQQKIVVPTARALASNYARATEGRSQHTMTKHADNN